jgi:hypothetical protein
MSYKDEALHHLTATPTSSSTLSFHSLLLLLPPLSQVPKKRSGRTLPFLVLLLLLLPLSQAP